MATRDRTQAHASKPHHTPAAKTEHAQPAKTSQPKQAAAAVTGRSTPTPAVALTLVTSTKAKQPAVPVTDKKMARAPLELVPLVKGPHEDPLGPDKGMHDEGMRKVQPPAHALKPAAKHSPKHAAPAGTGAPEAHAAPDEKRQGHAEPKEKHRHPAKKEGGGHEKTKHGEHAESHEAKHKGGGTSKGGVHLKMPEPPSHLSHPTQKRIAGVHAAAGVAASTHAALPGAAHFVTEAHGAVDQPPEEANAKAQQNLVAALDVQAAPSPEIEEICKKIKQVIKDKRPPDEDSLVTADPKAMATAASTEVKGGVQGETKKVETGYDGINQPAQGTPDKGGEMTPPPASVDSPPLNATQATPDAVPAQNVSLKADAADSKQSMEDAGMSKPAAQVVQTGPIADARAGQGELDQKAEQDPAMVLAKQQESLGRAQGNMTALQQQALAALTSSRKTTVAGTTGHQKEMVLSEEQQRTKASADAQKVFQDAQTQVDALLKDVTPKALELWDQKIDGLNTGFKNRLSNVKDRITERHSGFGGSLVSWWDDKTGLPDWVTDEYDAAEKEFGDGVCDLARQISIQVNTVILACQAIIKNARKDISDIFAKLPEALRIWAEGEQGKLNEQLNGLNHKAEQTRTDFNKQLVDHASQAVQDVRDQIHTLREAAKGLIGRILDAIKRFLDDPFKFIIDGLLSLVGISPASFWSLINKIAQVIGDIVDDPEKFGNNLFKGLSMGFSLFFDHFGKHLEEGFMEWLLGGIAAAGINLPKDFSLKSIMTFCLELMGITWPNIRKILAKHVGEKNIALIEKVIALMSTLIELGPSGVFELIKEKLNPAEILKQIVKMAIDYLIEALVKQAVARILMLFNPVGAILQAIEAIYKVLKWIFHNAAKIFKLVETVVNGLADIVAGNVGGFAKAVETGLAMLIAPVIDFIADYLGLGDLPDKVKERIEGFQQVVLGYVEQAIVFMIEKGKALLAVVGIGGKDKKEVEKHGSGAQGNQVGELETWTAAGESHRLWIAVNGNSAQVMMASDGGHPVLETLENVYSPRAEEALKNCATEEESGGKETARTERKVLEEIIKSRIPRCKELVQKIIPKAKEETGELSKSEGADPKSVAEAQAFIKTCEEQLRDHIFFIQEHLGLTEGDDKYSADFRKLKAALPDNRLFTAQKLAELVQVDRSNANRRIQVWKEKGILFSLASATTDKRTEYSVDPVKAGQKETDTETNRAKYGFVNPKKTSPTGLLILSKGLNAQSPLPWEPDIVSYHTDKARYQSMAPRSTYKDFNFADAILGHGPIGASVYWNDHEGHKKTKEDNLRWNRDPANYWGPEHWKESREEGGSAPGYKVPSEAIESNPQWY